MTSLDLSDSIMNRFPGASILEPGVSEYKVCGESRRGVFFYASYVDERDGLGVLELARRNNNGQAFVWEEDWSDTELLDYWRPDEYQSIQQKLPGNFTIVVYFWDLANEGDCDAVTTVTNCESDRQNNSPTSTGKLDSILNVAKNLQHTIEKRVCTFAGLYVLHKNQPGRGSHIANASYMVDDTKFGGNRLGVKLSVVSRKHAVQLGFRGLQFNIVVETNKKAVEVWEKAGFEKKAVVPGVYRRRMERTKKRKVEGEQIDVEEFEYVGAWIMFCDLVAWSQEQKRD